MTGMDEMSKRLAIYEALVWSAVWRYRRQRMTRAERSRISPEELYAAALVYVWKALRSRPDEPDGKGLGALVFVAARGGCREWLQSCGYRLAHRATRLRFGGECCLGDVNVRQLAVRGRAGSVVGATTRAAGPGALERLSA